MKKSLFILAVFGLTFMTACKKDQKNEESIIENEDTEQNQISKEIKLQVSLESKSDSNVKGNAIFIEENGVVTLIAEIEGLTQGEHAIHIHEKADCSSPDGMSTGGHWNPTKEPHGKWGSPTGYHKGDIGNFKARENGKGSINMSTDKWCIGCGDETKDIVGKAIIVHQGVDDFITQPTGDAGGRVSCGGIIQ